MYKKYIYYTYTIKEIYKYYLCKINQIKFPGTAYETCQSCLMLIYSRKLKRCCIRKGAF